MVGVVRLAFSMVGGYLGSVGSVAFLFQYCAQFVFAPGSDEELIMDVGLSGGADDVISNEDGSIEVIASPNEFNALKDVFDEANISPEVAEINHFTSTVSTLEGVEAVNMQ